MTVGVGIAALLAAAGCSGGGAGGTTTPTTSGSPSTSDSPTANLNGAPAVTDPLNTSKIASDPCGSITADQLAALDIGTTAKSSTTLGPTCDWGSSTDASKSHATLAYLTSGSGLGDIYSQKSTYAVFQELPPISGYPAIIAMDSDDRPHGKCAVVVGASDSLAFSVQMFVNSGQYQTNPCVVTEQLAAEVITNIKNGGS